MAWLAVGALLGVACRGLPPLRAADLDGWTALETEGMRLVGRIDAGELRRLARELQLFRRTVRQLVPVPPDRDVAPVTVFCLADPDLVSLYQPAFVVGWMLPALDGFFATVAVSRHHFATRHVLFHEYTHFLLRAEHRFAYPGWFDEGMSEYLSTLRLRDEVVLMGAAPTERMSWVNRRGLVPLDRLLDPAQEWKDAMDGFDFYASAWLLVHFLMSSQPGREDLTGFVTRLRRGEEPKWAAVHAIRWPLSELEPRVVAHGRKLAAGLSFELVFDATALEFSELRERPLAANEIGYALGDLALRLDQGRGSRAARVGERLFGLGLERDPGDARLRAGRAESLALRGRAEAAREQLDLALAEDRDDAGLLLRAGRTWRRSGEDAPAEQALRRAIELDPDSPVAHAELGELLRETGRPAEARTSLERASALGAWSPELDLGLAGVYVELGENRRARRLLRSLAHYPHSEEIAAEARRLLSTL